MKKSKYADYLEEIDSLTRKYNLSSMQVITLQFLASCEFNSITYEKFKQDVCKENITTKEEIVQHKSRYNMPL